MQTDAPKIILCVPGMWPDRQAVVQALAEKSGGFILVGSILQETATKTRFVVDIAEHDPALARAFAIAGRGTMGDSDVEPIRRHKLAVYLVGDGGSPEGARAMMRAAAGLLNAGGLGVKVESAGVAHNPANWAALLGSDEPAALYHAFVTMVGAEHVYYSCGMHNIGYPDVYAPRSLPSEQAARLMEAFLLYLLYDNPELANGHTFSLEAGSPRYRLQHTLCTMFPQEDSFYNPFGIWLLHPVSGG